MSINRLIGIFVAAGMATLSGCTNSATLSTANRPFYDNSIKTVSSSQRYIVDDLIDVPQSRTTVGKFNSQMIFMADQIERNVDRNDLENTFIVTNLTNLNNLAETSAFGRLISENIIHELQVRKWRVFEPRLAKNVTINTAGEFSLSRDIADLHQEYKAGGIVTGTYSVAGNHIIVNMRVIDITNGMVMSSAQAHFPVTWFTDSLLNSDDRKSIMKIIGADFMISERVQQ